MKITNVQIKPIQNGFLVSHYAMPVTEQPTRNCDVPCSPGEYIEEYYPDEKVAAKRMATLAADMQKTKK